MRVCVWPPQISIRTQGRVTRRAMSATSARAMAGSRYSSTYFIGSLFHQAFLGQLAHGLQRFVSRLRLFLINAADGITNVDEDVIAHLGLRHEIEANDAHDAAELNASHPAAIHVFRAEDLAGHGETHIGAPPRRSLQG